MFFVGLSENSVKYAHAGVAQLVRASVFQTEGRGFESRLPLTKSKCGVLRAADGRAASK